LPLIVARPADVFALSALNPGTIDTRKTLIVLASLLSTPPAAAAALRIALRSPCGRGLLLPGVPVRAKLLSYVSDRNVKATSTPACA
jgi:hypothetical protein